MFNTREMVRTSIGLNFLKVGSVVSKNEMDSKDSKDYLIWLIEINSNLLPKNRPLRRPIKIMISSSTTSFDHQTDSSNTSTMSPIQPLLPPPPHLVHQPAQHQQHHPHQLVPQQFHHQQHPREAYHHNARQHMPDLLNSPGNTSQPNRISSGPSLSSRPVSRDSSARPQTSAGLVDLLLLLHLPDLNIDTNSAIVNPSSSSNSNSLTHHHHHLPQLPHSSNTINLVHLNHFHS
ncbi:hypothetical protein PSTT_13558 [Puccinia striiformis]|uniref:Uncharacterized protein n=1 Tax=Puccinia striiformis TaxID=27350 RepID=A0A2S4UQX7_9BASI|nr:hypothetical protein PSTT_13558 [Puccinia striiformis]